MTRQLSAAQSREVRIELLRAQAAIQRQMLSDDCCTLKRNITPLALLRSVIPSSSRAGHPAAWLMDSLGLLRRYPYVASAASTLFSAAAGRRYRLVKIGLGLLVGWQLARVAASRAPEHSDSQDGSD